MIPGGEENAMRVRLGLAALMAGVLVLPAQIAGADGGSYFDFRGPRSGSHFLPGDGMSATAFVSIPEQHQDLLDRGPFYLFLASAGHSIREGRPLPQGTIRLGTAAIEHDSRTTFRITTNFTVPDVPGELYTVWFCNEPCTVSGFREPLYGQVSIVQTLREASLLNEQQRLFGKNWHLRRQVRRGDREIEELQTMVDSAQSERDDLARQVDDLESAIAAAERASDQSRPLVEGWALVAMGIAAIVALTSVALGLVFARRRADPPLLVPDTIAELDEEREDALARS
jgi:hypothetical protein